MARHDHARVAERARRVVRGARARAPSPARPRRAQLVGGGTGRPRRAPTTTTVTRAAVSADAPAERVAVVEQQRRLGGDVRRAGDRREDAAVVVAAVAAPSKTLPMMLSWRQTLALARACRRRPGRRAWRWCRCRTASGRRPRRGRARSCGCRRRAWAAGRTARRGRSRAPSSPVMPPRERVRIAAVSVGQRVGVGERPARRPWSSARKNQLPPQATSPVTVPRPGHVDAHALRVAVARHVLDVTRPSSCSVAVTTPTGVSMRCAPGAMRPEVRERRDRRRSCRGRTCRGSRRC